VRALLAAVATTAVIYVLGSYIMTGEPSEGGLFLDPLYIYPLVGGTVAYLLGRSRRSAFVAGSLGVLGLDIVHWVWLSTTGTPGTVNIGGAGAFDSIVVAGLVAVLLAEIVGETRERIQGGPESEGHDPALLRNLQSMDKNEKTDGEDK
jgi:uncharacterized membrane protein